MRASSSRSPASYAASDTAPRAHCVTATTMMSFSMAARRHDTKDGRPVGPLPVPYSESTMPRRPGVCTREQVHGGARFEEGRARLVYAARWR